MSANNMIIILGDQLSHPLSALKAGDKTRDVVVMAEVMDEADHVQHHKKKLAFVFASMRHFAQELLDDGWDVRYTKLGEFTSFNDWLKSITANLVPNKIITTEASEYRVLEMQKSWSQMLSRDVDILPDDRFITTHGEFQNWAEGRKQLRMEYFYREVRKKTDILMEGDKPVGGQWNYDAENRKAPPNDLFTPGPFKFEPDEITSEVIEMVEEKFPDRFGKLADFWFATNAVDASRAVDHFIAEKLQSFGDYQDAMVLDEPFMYHSLIAQYINIGFLDPLEVCKKVETAFYEQKAPLNAVEGFIRQIIGWREYIRGIYWLKMPEYVEENYFGADRSLPDFYWTGETKMQCLKSAVTQTIDHAYAHHIQRLMVTGNFAMLIGVEPKQVHEWYLAVYADAYEWVELPNTIGMSQFADGGVLGSKPYAAGGNYMNKMSNYCKSCHYSVSKKTGEGACPFNALYWDFLARNQEKLVNNPRLGPVYRTWARMSEEKQKDTRNSAEVFINSLYE